MPGGNKNIKPSDGKQFSSEYQPEEKWTEKKALKLGNDLINWLKKDEEHIFYREYLTIVNDFEETLTSRLAHKFSSFKKLLSRAKKIQEIKLMKYGVFDKLNAQMTKFTLINNHGWSDRKEIVVEKNQEIIIQGTNAKKGIDNLPNPDE